MNKNYLESFVDGVYIKVMKKKVGLNFLFNILSTVISLVLGIIIPRLFIVSLGSETNGLVTSVAQIYAYIGLMEAGIGATVLQALYAPIARGDRRETNQILSASHQYYRKIGILYIVCVFLLAFLYPCIVTTTIDIWTVVGVVIFSGLGGGINFLFQQNYVILLAAEGKGYVTTVLTMIVNVATSLTKAILLLLGFDVLAVMGTQFVITLIRIILLRIYINKNYGWIDLTLPPKKEALSKQKYVMVQQLSYFVYSNTDVLILTAFCGLKTVSVYTIYNLVVGTLESVLAAFTNSVVFAFGQMYSQDRIKFKRLFTMFDTLYMTLLFALFTVMYICVTPFMSLYTAGVTDANYVDSKLALLFVLMKLVTTLRSQSQNSINFAGKFKETQKSAVIEAVSNLVVSVVAVQFVGIYGVLLGSIVSTFYRGISVTQYSNKYIMEYTKKESIDKYRRWIVNLICFSAIPLVLRQSASTCDTYIELVIFAGEITVVTLAIYFGALFVTDRKISMDAISVVRERINQK